MESVVALGGVLGKASRKVFRNLVGGVGAAERLAADD